MSMSDPVSDFLTRIRNAYRAGKEVIEAPHSKLLAEIARILKKEGFITDFAVEGGSRKTLRLYLKYTDEGSPVIVGIERKSKPGIRVYSKVDSIPRVLGGLGVTILSTSAGILTGSDARAKGIGGEVLCFVW